MTQEELSEKSGLAPQHLSRLETARQVPSLDTIVDLAHALGSSVAILLGEPQQFTESKRMNRIAAMFSVLTEEDSAFLESQLAGWMSYIRDRSNH